MGRVIGTFLVLTRIVSFLDLLTSFIRIIEVSLLVRIPDRSKFIGPYSCLLKGTLQYWSDNVKVMKFGGEYEWHRLSMARNEMNRLYCISVRIHDDVCKMEKLEAQIDRRDKLLKYSRVMLWTFEDNTEPCERMYFTPGTKSVLAMNWTFVELYVKEEEKAEFTEKMRACQKLDRMFEMAVTLKYENYGDAHVILQGRGSPQLGRVIGTAIEVNDLWERKMRTMQSMAEIEEKREEKETRSAKRVYDTRCLFNNIFGLMDVLLARSTSREETSSLVVVQTLSHTLMDVFLDPLRSKKDEGALGDRSFVCLDMLETVMQSGYLHVLHRGSSMDAVVRGRFPDAVLGPENEARVVLTAFVSYISDISKNVCYSIEWHGGYLTVAARFDSTHVEFDGYNAMMKQFGGMSAMSEHVSEQLIEDIRNQSFNQNASRRGSVTVSPCPLEPSNRLQASQSDSAARGGMSWTKQLSALNKKLSSGDEDSDSRPPMSPTRRGSIQDRVAKRDKSHWFAFSASAGYFTVSLPLLISTCATPFPEISIAYRTCDPSINAQIESEIQSLSMTGTVLDKVSKEAIERVDIVIVDEKDPELPDIRKCIETIFKKTTLLVIHNPGSCNIDGRLDEGCLLRPVISGQLRSAVARHMHQTPIGHYKSLAHIDRIERRVLVVEDDITNQFMMQKILEALGCTVELAENGEEALRILDEQDFDIVFMDYQLPVLDGVATTKIMRNSPKAYASIPIVGISGSLQAEEECMKAGMNVFYPKPIRIHHVKDALTAYYG